MGKKGKKKNQAEKQKKNGAFINESIQYKILAGKLKYFQYLPVFSAFAAGIYFVYYSFITNGFHGFPLDDPWIHLTFAKNLTEFGSFSYYKNEVVTSGSTSPVYTVLLSLLFVFSKNEFIISYLIGIISGILAIHMMIKLSARVFPPADSSRSYDILIIFTALLAALHPKLNLINVSGMETSMFIFLIAAGLYAYQCRKMLLLGIFLGLAVWCRPDGFVLWGAVLCDYLLQQYYFKRNEKETHGLKKSDKIIKAFLTAFVFLAGYFVFNYALSGSVLPNTYNAKLEYYGNNDRSSFLENEVIGYFTGDEFSFLWIPFTAGLIGILRSFFKKEYTALLALLFFVTGLILVYYVKLPFAHRFGRYLMPVIPFYIIISVSGLKVILDFISVRLKGISRVPGVIFSLYALITIGFFIHYNFRSSEEYAFFCRYHNERHAAAGNWLKNNTDESAVVAAHDIGAIAFYSKRKIIDMAGLVTPELIDVINKPSYSAYLNKYLADNKINYLAVLKNWFEVVNDNPVYVPVNAAEFLEVYDYKPGKTYIQPKQVSYLNQTAMQAVQRGSPADAIAYLNQSLNIDRHSSQTKFMLGAVTEMMRNYPAAEKNYREALRLFPEYAEAYFGLASINFKLNRREGSKIFLERCLALKPGFPPAVQLKNQLNYSSPD